MKRILFVASLAVLGIALLAGQSTQANGFQLPTISVSPTSVNFGSVPVGAVASQDIIITNGSPDLPLTVNAVKTKSPFSDNATSFTVPPSGSHTITVAFAPSSPIAYNGVCTIQSNATNSPTLNVPLSGMGQ